MASDALSCITKLKKLCNHPKLLYYVPPKGNKEATPIITEPDVPEELQEEGFDPRWSGKMIVTENLLLTVKKNSDDRVVLISNSTKISFSFH